MKRFSALPAALALLLTLGGCSLHNKDDSTPAATVSQAASTAAATAPAGLSPANSQTITDGICTTLIPEDWIDSGNGRGTSPSGARFTLFGNKLSGDAAWSAAAGLVATVAVGKNAKADESTDSVTFVSADGSSFEVRRRLADRYCDFSVTSAKPAPGAERALWPAIGASMTAAP